ncbi:ABC transporter permease [Effusibacillus pohliae]|uniref:ABC transporter permease n=1 Tax=Effusibacillus pohliae TaxID=232270 RepID=UPI0003708E77|nr:ABC transporter permease [Effusibacillus pohliae]
MRKFVGLVENETIKLLKRKRFLVVVLILVGLVTLLAYAQQWTQQRMLQRVGTLEWKPVVQQQIADYESRMRNAFLSEDRKQLYQLRIEQARYYLAHDINPAAPGTATFVRTFMDASVSLLLPLLVVTLAADLVSSEWGDGTIKLLLTRPVPRWKILAAKYAALILFVSLTVMAAFLSATVVGGLFFGWMGWTMPVATGFSIVGGTLDTSGAHTIPQWQYILRSYGLGWVVCMAVATITFTVSVIVRQTAAAMGLMLAALIGGNLLLDLASSWTGAKYLFMVNLRITGYLSGIVPPIEGMSLPFSLAVLLAWGAAALALGFAVFTKRDVLA